jgi:hypothetical protein
VPSGLWRIALGLGAPVGFTGSLATELEAPGWVTLYVVVLSVVTEGLALSMLGLVSPWGEVSPRWAPFVGGRTIPPAVVVTVAALGAIAVTAFMSYCAYVWNGPANNGNPEAPQGLAGLVMTACYAPMLAWGPLLAAVMYDYYRRHRW